jgi:hypothetical protein
LYHVTKCIEFGIWRLCICILFHRFTNIHICLKIWWSPTSWKHVAKLLYMVNKDSYKAVLMVHIYVLTKYHKVSFLCIGHFEMGEILIHSRRVQTAVSFGHSWTYYQWLIVWNMTCWIYTGNKTFSQALYLELKIQESPLY